MSKPLIGAPIGADVDAIVAGATDDDGVYTTGYGAPAQLGSVVNGIDGTRYMLVQAASTSAAMASARSPNAYAIDSNFRAKLITLTLAQAGNGLGFAPQAGEIAAHDYFWARIAGKCTARIQAAASAAKYLRVTSTAGLMGTASSVAAVNYQAVLPTAAPASASALSTAAVTVYMGQLTPVTAV